MRDSQARARGVGGTLQVFAAFFHTVCPRKKKDDTFHDTFQVGGGGGRSDISRESSAIYGGEKRNLEKQLQKIQKQEEMFRLSRVGQTLYLARGAPHKLTVSLSGVPHCIQFFFWNLFGKSKIYGHLQPSPPPLTTTTTTKEHDHAREQLSMAKGKYDRDLENLIRSMEKMQTDINSLAGQRDTELADIETRLHEIQDRMYELERSEQSTAADYDDDGGGGWYYENEGYGRGGGGGGGGGGGRDSGRRRR